MDSLKKALMNRKGKEIKVMVDDMEVPVESAEEAAKVVEKAMSMKDMVGFSPFESISKEKEFESDDEDMDDYESMGSDEVDEDDQTVSLKGVEAEIADPKIMQRLKNGAKPKGLFEKVQANLMKKGE